MINLSNMNADHLLLFSVQNNYDNNCICVLELVIK